MHGFVDVTHGASRGGKGRPAAIASASALRCFTAFISTSKSGLPEPVNTDQTSESHTICKHSHLHCPFVETKLLFPQKEQASGSLQVVLGSHLPASISLSCFVPPYARASGAFARENVAMLPQKSPRRPRRLDCSLQLTGLQRTGARHICWGSTLL